MSSPLPFISEGMEEEMVTHSRILAWKSHGQRSLADYSPWGRLEVDTTYRIRIGSFLSALEAVAPFPSCP